MIFFYFVRAFEVLRSLVRGLGPALWLGHNIRKMNIIRQIRTIDVALRHIILSDEILRECGLVRLVLSFFQQSFVRFAVVDSRFRRLVI